MSAKKRETLRLVREDDRPAEDWRELFVSALPLLEDVAAHGNGLSEEKQELARKLIVRHYIAATNRPGLAKAKPRRDAAS